MTAKNIFTPSANGRKLGNGASRSLCAVCLYRKKLQFKHITIIFEIYMQTRPETKSVLLVQLAVCVCVCVCERFFAQTNLARFRPETRRRDHFVSCLYNFSRFLTEKTLFSLMGWVLLFFFGHPKRVPHPEIYGFYAFGVGHIYSKCILKQQTQKKTASVYFLVRVKASDPETLCLWYLPTICDIGDMAPTGKKMH